MERKREEIYMHDADGEETHGIHRRVQSRESVKRSELAIAVVSVARIQEPVVMAALQRQC